MTHGGDRKTDQAANLPIEITQAEAATMFNVSERLIRTVWIQERASLGRILRGLYGQH